MNVLTPYSPSQGGISPDAPQSPAQLTPSEQEASGNAARQAVGAMATSGTTFIPPHVFNHWVMNLMGRSVVRHMSLREWRLRSKQKGPDSSRPALAGNVDDAIDPVSGRSRTPEVSLVLNLLRDHSGDDQRERLEEQLKARKLNPSQRLQVYIEAAANVDSEGLSPEDAARIKQILAQSVHEIQSTNRHVIRQSIHDPDKLREAVETIAGPIEKLMAVMERELRVRRNPDSPHTTMDRIDVPYQALSLVVFGNKLAGPEHCWKFIATLRKMTKPEF